MLDPQSQAMLDEIATKEVAALTPEDIGFLRARKFYLNSDQHNRYAEVLSDEPAQEPEAEQAAEQEAPKRKSRKEAEQE